MTDLNLPLRAFEAELRAVEEGHVARSDGRGRFFVSSDTYHDKSYLVTVTALAEGDPLTFDCQPQQAKAYEDDHLHRRAYDGFVGCKHMALVGRSLVRRKQADVDDDFSSDGHRVVPFPEISQPDDPWSGLPT